MQFALHMLSQIKKDEARHDTVFLMKQHFMCMEQSSENLHNVTEHE